MEQNNPQLRNVGNLGDILKHAALMNIAKMLTGRNSARFAYIETHAFMLEASCPNPAQWERETKAELTKHPAYNDYYAAEKKVLDKLPYRCSAGLVIDKLKKANATDAVIVLAEKNEATREILRDQLGRNQVKNYTILEDALRLGFIKLPDDVGTLLILVDPFILDDQLWNGIVAALSKTVKPEMEVVLELFTFDKKQTAVQWPSPPAGMVGPISVMHRQPYHLAVYATAALRENVSLKCQALGWSMH